MSGGNGAAISGSSPATSGGFGTGWTKLLGSSYGSQVGWLYPLALFALFCGLAWTRRAGRTDPARAGFLLWGTWLFTYGLIFSQMSSIPHTAYVASLAPPLAALSAAGIVMFWRAYRERGWRAWVLPVTVTTELAWVTFLWRDYGGFLPWARTTADIIGIAAIVVLIAAMLSRRNVRRLITVGLAAGVAAMLAAPATWAASVLDVKYAGSSFNASAGPADGVGPASTPSAAVRTAPPGGSRLFTRSPVGSGAPGANASGSGGHPGPGARDGSGAMLQFGGGAIPQAGGAGGMMGATTALTAPEQAVYDYVTAHRDGASYLMAVDSWDFASPYILATGQEVLPMGGFSGSVPEPTLERVKQLVSTGQLRFFLLGAGGGAAIGGRGGGSSDAIAAWVHSTCTSVPARDYLGTSAASRSSLGYGAASGSQVLYSCKS